jgi:multidrug efflux pump subunit AcrA (membrane-fusion protein)
VVCDHSAAALGNALEHQHLFLMPVWRAIGKSRWLIEARTLPKTVAVGALVVAALLALTFVPYRFDLQSNGTLQPTMRREVFANIDGRVERILVKHGEQVHKGQLLAEMRNTDLEVQYEDVTGQRAAAQEQLLAVHRAIYDEGKRMPIDERNRLEGQRAELKQKLMSLDSQIALLKSKLEKLKVVAPTDGEMVTWDVDTLLGGERPVQQGQVLMSVAQTNGNWELELRMPEDRAGHLAAAWKELEDRNREQGTDDKLAVTYRLATNPGVDHEGRVTKIHEVAEVFGEDGNTVLVKVEIDHTDLDYKRPGADVMAKIHCGYRSMGYVWLHDVIAFIQSRILFKL